MRAPRCRSDALAGSRPAFSRYFRGSAALSAARFAGIKDTHAHEEKLRAESMAIIESDPEFGRRLEMIEKAMAIIFTFTIDHTSRTVDENTAQMLGVRLFNAAGTGLKLALSGYYQAAFHQARDIMETGFLLDYFRTSPGQISVWRTSDRATRRKFFDPVKIRIALDDRDKDTEKKTRSGIQQTIRIGVARYFSRFLSYIARRLWRAWPLLSRSTLRHGLRKWF